MNAAAPIQLRTTARGTQVAYRRADLEPLLRGMPAERALALLPRLLPVCGEAQRSAAQRALAAACDEAPGADAAAEQDLRLLREQAQAAAWRLFVDWPRWQRRGPQLHRVRELKSASDAALAAALRRVLPACGADGLDDALSALDAAAGPAGAFLRAARDLQWPAPVDVPLLAGEALGERALQWLSPATPGTPERGGAAIVGPLAMCRHRLLPRLAGRRDRPLVARLLLAQWLDMLAIADALERRVPPPAPQRPWRALGAGRGLGTAVTARGPLFHVVALDDARRVRSWRYLAPTDWYFAPGGPVAAAAAAVSEARKLRLLLAAADPCAACELRGDEGDPPAEAA